MKLKKLHKKNISELNSELLKLLHEQFNLRMQISSRQLQKTHLLKRVRRNIARIKTFLTKQENS